MGFYENGCHLKLKQNSLVSYIYIYIERERAKQKEGLLSCNEIGHTKKK